MSLNYSSSAESSVVSIRPSTTKRLSGVKDGAESVIINRLIDAYADPIDATIREIISNAVDASIVAKDFCPAVRPIEITSPTDFYSFFVVRDYGVGMSADKLYDVFQIGSSDKRDNPHLTGAYGLGIKAPLSYVNSFVVESVYEGKKSTAYITRSNLGIETDVRTVEDTDEESGTTVTIAVEPYDISIFQNLINKYRNYAFTAPIIIDGYEYYQNKDFVELGFINLPQRIDLEGNSVDVLCRTWLRTSSVKNFFWSRSSSDKKHDPRTSVSTKHFNIGYLLSGYLYRSDFMQDFDNIDVVIEIVPNIFNFSTSRDQITRDNLFYSISRHVHEEFADNFSVFFRRIVRHFCDNVSFKEYLDNVIEPLNKYIDSTVDNDGVITFYLTTDPSFDIDVFTHNNGLNPYRDQLLMSGKIFAVGSCSDANVKDIASIDPVHGDGPANICFSGKKTWMRPSSFCKILDERFDDRDSSDKSYASIIDYFNFVNNDRMNVIVVVKNHSDLRKIINGRRILLSPPFYSAVNLVFSFHEFTDLENRYLKELAGVDSSGNSLCRVFSSDELLKEFSLVRKKNRVSADNAGDHDNKVIVNSCVLYEKNSFDNYSDIFSIGTAVYSRGRSQDIASFIKSDDTLYIAFNNKGIPYGTVSNTLNGYLHSLPADRRNDVLAKNIVLLYDAPKSVFDSISDKDSIIFSKGFTHRSAVVKKLSDTRWYDYPVKYNEWDALSDVDVLRLFYGTMYKSYYEKFMSLYNHFAPYVEDGSFISWIYENSKKYYSLPHNSGDFLLVSSDYIKRRFTEDNPDFVIANRIFDYYGLLFNNLSWSYIKSRAGLIQDVIQPIKNRIDFISEELVIKDKVDDDIMRIFVNDIENLLKNWYYHFMVK